MQMSLPGAHAHTHTHVTYTRNNFLYRIRIYRMGWDRFEPSYLWQFENLDKMIKGKAATFHNIEDGFDGTGFVVNNGCIYYNKVSTLVCVCCLNHWVPLSFAANPIKKLNKHVECPLTLPIVQTHGGARFVFSLADFFLFAAFAL